ncbi:MAG: phosphatase PAP2 family protein [Ilumatobacteraceae bacterium]
MAAQLALVTGAVIGYFGVRGLTEGDPDSARRNAIRLIDIERAVGLDLEQRVQDAFTRADWSTNLVNWVYIWAHWPILIGTLIWLGWLKRHAYLALRNAMIVSGVIGLVIFATFPVTPPRLADLGFLDTVTVRSESYRVLQPPAFVNRYAAMPSLHFGWNLLVGVVWYRVGRSAVWRVAAVVMPVAMAVAVVATANHWLLDVVVGGALALLGLLVADRLSGVEPDRQEPRSEADGGQSAIERADAIVSAEAVPQPGRRHGAARRVESLCARALLAARRGCLRSPPQLTPGRAPI